ncbi:glycosyltransferase family 90 protein [Mixia osmundae IAM 14324]|uniref:Glycosyl transferase CAP10 domain-containing protein n=1 Tax=Mixia osmundae (strain CBS 9802 / IAM 14324 / JCM 22182 / KY 12970) TaxID=764103 RepID=G7DVY2_MIXOS|nr:glycosyltransferase family 90 protein [Mixia osmundae IAM 14324]KEI39577.1 glycosyltransferase family 90 protein [Mixia osmundae IAM 14324]GAA94742.1 hypothetical protein E5Q_01396 [Mixia osmundae IAM 14324]
MVRNSLQLSLRPAPRDSESTALKSPVSPGYGSSTGTSSLRGPGLTPEGYEATSTGENFEQPLLSSRERLGPTRSEHTSCSPRKSASAVRQLSVTSWLGARMSISSASSTRSSAEYYADDKDTPRGRGQPSLRGDPAEALLQGRTYDAARRRSTPALNKRSRKILLLAIKCLLVAFGVAGFTFGLHHYQNDHAVRSMSPYQAFTSWYQLHWASSEKLSDHHESSQSLFIYDANSGRFNRPTVLPMHPVRELIDRARKDWNQKVARQSKTLEEAVDEYVRRYKRRPPRGFDIWWKYAVDNDVVLVDEFDKIYRDVEPYYALDAHQIATRQRIAVERINEIVPGQAVLVDIDPERIRLNDSILLDEIPESAFRAKGLLHRSAEALKLLPAPITLPMNEDDAYVGRLSYGHHQHLLRLARTGQYVPSMRDDGYTQHDAFDAPEAGPANFTREAALCPPGSAIYEAGQRGKAGFEPDKDHFDTPPFHSLVYDIKKASDHCHNPEVLWFEVNPSRFYDFDYLSPVFSWSTTGESTDLTVVPEQFPINLDGDLPFDQKPGTRLFWRGAATGAFYLENNTDSWYLSPRYRLHQMARKQRGERSIMREMSDGSVDQVIVARKDLNERFLNMSIVGGPIQCEPSVCDRLQKEMGKKPYVPMSEFWQNKYVLDVDGNGWSGRFKMLMSSQSLVFKSSFYEEWWQERSQPWVHFVPVSPDYSDIYDIMAFFEGGIKGSSKNEDLAAEIAAAGRDWAMHHWRRADTNAYMLRLLLEWTRLLHRSEEDSWDYQ